MTTPGHKRVLRRAVLTGAGGFAMLLGPQPALSADAPPPDTGVCVDVRIGAERSADWACLNSALAHEVSDAKTHPIVDAIGGSLPLTPTALNLFSEAATAQRLGSAFGHSVIPERPLTLYSNPLIMKK